MAPAHYNFSQSDWRALDILESNIHATIAQIGKTSPKVARELEVRVQIALSGFADLKEALPKALAQVKAIQEKEQKGGGGKHI